MKRSKWFVWAFYSLIAGALTLAVGMIWVGIEFNQIQAEKSLLDSRVVVLETQVAAVQSNSSRMADLEGRVVGLEADIENLCRVNRRQSLVNDALVSLSNPQDIVRIEDAYDRIQATWAYCTGAGAISVNVAGSGLTVAILGTEVNSHLRGYWSQGNTPTLPLSIVDDRGNVIVAIDDLNLQRGDFLKVWVTDERPIDSGFYDPVTGLAIKIVHLAGNHEPNIG